jgi:hypothetical protein
MEHAIVYHRNIFTGMFVVKVNHNFYSVFKSFDITSFSVGDKLYGDFRKRGQKNIVHSNTLKWHTIEIHQAGSEESVALEKANVRE